VIRRKLTISIAKAGGALALPLLAVLPSCARVDSNVKVEPIEIKPIHATFDVNVNVNVRVERELDHFFAFEDDGSTSQPATRPATQPAPQ
jgi:hypothetical protein